MAARLRWLNLTILRGRSVFVTGAYGLLGGWLVKALLDRGARVTVLKRDAVTASALVLEETERLVNVVRGDVCDATLLERALSEYEVDTVFHLAAQTIVGVANRAPLSTFETVHIVCSRYASASIHAWATSPTSVGSSAPSPTSP